MLGYDVSRWTTFFDAGARQKVCSVGVRACFEHMRKVKEALGLVPPFDVLFSRGGKKLHVERTCPADFGEGGWFGEVAE